MPEITGDGRFTAEYVVPASGVFPATAAVRYELGISAVYRRSGTDTDQADRVHPFRYTFAASTAQEIDLLALVGPRITLFMVKFDISNVTGGDPAAWLRFGGAATNPWGEITGLTVRPGTLRNAGGNILTSSNYGHPVTLTSKILRMTPSAHAFSVDLFILGTSV